MSQSRRAALIYPTHANLAEELERYQAAEIPAAAFPVRTTEQTPHQAPNCWNEEADQAEQIGLPVVRTICHSCASRQACNEIGYLQETITAREADVCLATHQRAAVTGFEELTADRYYIAVHENPLQILRPQLTLQPRGLSEVRELVHRLLTDPFYLNWLGDDRKRDEDGNWTSDPAQLLRRQRIWQTLGLLDQLLEQLHQQMEAATTPTPWKPAITTESPPGFEAFIWWAINHANIRFTGAPWDFVLAALHGRLREGLILVTGQHVRGAAAGATLLRKEVTAVLHNPPPSGAVVWFCDATLDRRSLAAVIDGPVQDGTPDGLIPLKREPLQYVRDITRQTSHKIFLGIVRGLLCQHRDRQRIGIITHSNLTPVLQHLDQEFADRIAHVAYFGSGEERSSNRWHETCDLILVLGTPRVPPATIMAHLAQTGRLEATQKSPRWDEVHWYARTVSGEERKFTGRGYHDEVWLRAHRNLVRATLRQAIGRGRGILENGCDVIVVSSEECGLKVIDEPVPLFNERLIVVWRELQKLAAEKSNRYLLDKPAVSTSELAIPLKFPDRSLRVALQQLEGFGLVHRDGPRSGWILGPRPCAFHSHDRQDYADHQESSPPAHN